jgi:hypothetical protein
MFEAAWLLELRNLQKKLEVENLLNGTYLPKTFKITKTTN